ncbi:Ni/Fe hydrogenase subunit alpha [Roseospira marina]|uniref:Ni/Fe hydrogenase subunit alpha n=1 Tax=Roseospira marina TaxID=140057 RepID=A0A5M6IBE0_9PROT|nr:nickel-dependent hydrogenase large subunit [Roseospira marina]KAA5605553.1 Ni/Fe hydrogenase subunit alpha [Roseospira marina]MBB4313386.1 coenzyme F420-reducing hydrogenase alpha subunit [Roseospira marina]MBB5085873.1 coenzyme F420-reducing hydrogenase alpha subunit [Roseospira marina]
MAEAHGTTRRIAVENLARVEGEGALRVRIRNGELKDVAFTIHEPPRFFEALLRGRPYTDAPDITARICGICPLAYMLGASLAMEDALGVPVSNAMRGLRRLIYCGEWIESHVLHIAMLHAPDFLGYEDSIRMAQDHPDVVETALRLKTLGNRIVEVIGGRAIHPVNLRVGGLYRSPTREEILALRPELDWALEAARGLVAFTATLPMPSVERDYLFVALHTPDHYAVCEGRLVSSAGLDVPVSAFHDHFTEDHQKNSNALVGATRDGQTYHVGPLARYALNFDQLADEAKAAAQAAGLPRVVRNPFQSIIVRAVETLQAVLDARALVEAYEPPDPPCPDITPRAGTGHGCTEAPRGLCHHTYTLDDSGHITHACIVPPTAQNQRSIGEDLRDVVAAHLAEPDERLTWICEQAIRNYDPCISCATHFLRLEVDRG